MQFYSTQEVKLRAPKYVKGWEGYFDVFTLYSTYQTMNLICNTGEIFIWNLSASRDKKVMIKKEHLHKMCLMTWWFLELNLLGLKVTQLVPKKLIHI